MEKNDFDKDEIIKYWIDSSDEDCDTMMAMYDSKRFSNDNGFQYKCKI